MSPLRSPRRAPLPVAVRPSVFAVGRRVYVTCSGNELSGAILTDEAGNIPLANLKDGTEVTVLGWRPSGSTGARYRVRTVGSDVDGWLPVENLRSTEIRMSSSGEATPLIGSPVPRPR